MPTAPFQPVEHFPPDEDFGPGRTGHNYPMSGLPKDRLDRSKGETPCGGPHPYYDHSDTSPVTGTDPKE